MKEKQKIFEFIKNRKNIGKFVFVFAPNNQHFELLWSHAKAGLRICREYPGHQVKLKLSSLDPSFVVEKPPPA